MAEQSGEEFGPYLLEEVIGRGGMGVVYRAYDTRRDRIVALKRLPRELAEDEHFQARFRRESRLAARLNEPHIIPIHDFGEHDGQLFLDMRLVEGVDLSTLISDEGGRLAVDLAVDIIVQVSAALSAAHTAGLMHRDIKPSNVLISGMTAEDRTSPFAYLVDFGIARTIGNEGTALTSTTDWFGTVAYMAPERISGSSGDARSDIYSLACLFYQCLTGQAPYTGEALQVLFAHVNNAPPSASAKAPAVAPGLDAAIRRGMAKKPEDRFQTVAQFAAAVKSAARGGVAPTGIPTTPQQARGPFGPVPPPAGRAGGPSFPPNSGPRNSGPRNSGSPVLPPQWSVPPGQSPRTSVPPYAAPVSSQPPHAGPVSSLPPHAGPRTSQPPSQPRSQPYAGPPTSQPPQAGPRTSVPPHAGPPTSQPPRPGQSGPGQSGPGQSGPRAAQPPYAGPHISQPPHAGPPQSIPPRPAAPVNNTPLLIMIAVAVVVVLAAIIAVIVATSGDGDPNASGATGVALSQSLDPSTTTTGSLVGSQTTPATDRSYPSGSGSSAR